MVGNMEPQNVALKCLITETHLFITQIKTTVIGQSKHQTSIQMINKEKFPTFTSFSNMLYACLSRTFK